MLCFVIIALVVVKMVQCTEYRLLYWLKYTYRCMRFWTPLKKSVPTTKSSGDSNLSDYKPHAVTTGACSCLSAIDL